MAIANPVQAVHARDATVFTFYTDGLAVKFFTSLDASPVSAFNQDVADRPVAALCRDDGELQVLYVNTGGAIAQKASRLDGAAGSWS